MGEETDIQMRRLFAETAETPEDTQFVDAVDARVAKARTRRQWRNWSVVGLALVAAASLAPSVGFMAERVTAAAAEHTNWTTLAASFGGLPSVQAAGMALAAAACALVFVRVQD